MIYYLIYGFEYENLVEGHFYDLTLYSDAEKENVIYKDRAFSVLHKKMQYTVDNELLL